MQAAGAAGRGTAGPGALFRIHTDLHRLDYSFENTIDIFYEQFRIEKAPFF